MKEKRKVQIIGILLATFALLSFISLVGHQPSDDMMITSDEAVYGNPFSLPYANYGGMMGAYFSYVAFFFLGWTAYFAVIYLFVLSFRIVGISLAKRAHKHAGMLWGLSFLVFLIADIGKVRSGMLRFEVPDGVGALGQTLIEIMLKIVGTPGAYIVSVAAIACILVYYWSISHKYRNLMTFLKEGLLKWFMKGWERAKPQWEGLLERLNFKRTAVIRGEKKTKKNSKKPKHVALPGQDNEPEPAENVIVEPKHVTNNAKPKPKKVTISRGSESKQTADVESPKEIDINAEFEMPSTEILDDPPNQGPAYDVKELEETAKGLRETLETFGVRLAGNIEMFPGPIITRFEIKPAAGIKVNQIANLSEDLALNLRAKSIRIVAPIPGKAAVGIEIPNRNPQIVYIREILESDEYQNNKFQLPLALGKDISGKPFTVDLASMPHLLIAGTTGSGKSVCINTIVTSLMYCLHPQKLKFIFIDPKMLELTVYQNIPYLEDRVVTNAKQAERVLGEAVAEMEKRYRTLANESVRNIVDYNRKMKSENKKLPYIVIVIDELADLMMSGHSSRIELLITRLAQMARAVGIHLILATQRPSVDVITGLIKANFPSRIAFQVATRTDSRTILDGNGAERLLGKGDMLYLETGSPEPERLHGAFISSDETGAIVEFMKGQDYSKKRVEEAQVEAEEKSQIRQFTSDPVMLEAIETVVRQGQASVSLLQRKLGIGYQRAARLIDDLEEKQIIGPYNESKARDVLVDLNFLEGLKKGKISKK